MVENLRRGTSWAGLALVVALATVLGMSPVAEASHNPPSIEPIADRTLTAGETLVIPVDVSAPSGHDVTVSVDGLPDFATFNSANNRITLAPEPGDEGTHGPITVTATSSGAAPQFRAATAGGNTGITASTLELDVPEGTTRGDMLLAQIRYRGDPASLTAPDGWQVLDTIQGTSQSNHTVLYKFADASEPASYTFDQDVAEGRLAGGIGAYSGVDPDNPIDAWDATGDDTTVPEAPGIITETHNTRVVRLWGWRSSEATDVVPPSGVTQRWTFQTGHAATDRNRVLAGDHVRVTAGSVGTSTASVSGELNNPNAFTVALAPEDDGGTTSTTFSVTVESPETPPIGEDHFTDDDGHLFEDDINAIATEGITRGCNPPDNTLFCPDDSVTRGQMAAFLVRALGYTDDGGGDRFLDDDHSVFEGDIDRLATAGVTRGCNPPDNDRFCPDEELTRGQMAAFLVRALGYTDPGPGDLFVDDDDSVFEGDIDRLATAGVTRGCNPPENNRFCPDENLTRGQMAAFLARALIYNR